MEKIVLLDSNSLIHRAYYALASSNLTDAKGRPTGAVFGFFSMLARLIAEEKPTHIAAAFDMRAPTFRHKLYKEYKGTRKPMPDDLAAQLPLLKQMLGDFGIKILELEGYEADDIIGTMAKRFSLPTVIVTGDRDALQLVDATTKVCYTKRGITDVVMYDEATLFDETGLTPRGFLEYKALRGDTSDNIPGVNGVGEKTAVELLTRYKTLDGVFAHSDDLKGKLKERIETGREQATLSLTLATIDTDSPVKCGLEDMKFEYPLPKRAADGLRSLQFNSLLKRFLFTDNDETDGSFAEIDVVNVNIEDIDALKEAVKDCVGKPVAITFGDGICFSSDAKKEYTAVPSYDLFGGLSFDDIITAVEPLLSAATDKILYDYKKARHILSESGIGISGGIYDTMLMAHLIKGGKHFAQMSDMLTAFGFVSSGAAALLVCADKLKAELKAKKLERLYFDLELPLADVLFDMEVEGVRADSSVLRELGMKYSDELETLSTAIFKYAGESFNINSPKQLGTVLFDKLQLKSRKKNKTGLSVGIEVLTKLYDEHPIIPLIIRYRQLSKLQSTYADGLIKEIASDGKIHTDFNQTVTSTGRLSSTAPNLQNIPTRTAEGREIRRAFVAGKGRVLISADYSQIELRLLAHFSGDENLIAAYNESRDIHATTAAEIFNVPQSEVTSEMRRDAKAVNFGIIYGISDFGLAQNLSIGSKRAKAYIDRYFETYPRVKEYMNKNVEFALEHGYIRSYSGRIRELPELKSGNRNLIEFGKRAAMNLPLQGTAADIIKIAMLEVAKRLEGLDAKMILQVHDELIIESSERDAEKAIGIVTECMEHAVELKVPLTVNVKSGYDWYSAE